MNEVMNLNAAFNLAKPVLMVPETIRSKPLFVNKEIVRSTWVISVVQLTATRNNGRKV